MNGDEGDEKKKERTNLLGEEKQLASTKPTNLQALE